MHTRLICLLALGLTACDAADPWSTALPDRVPVAFVSDPIPPIAPVPSPEQLAYQRMEMNAFVTFGLNTFTDYEWGPGTIDPDVFHPSAFDPAQWVALFREVGFRGLVLVAKHHDGFLLWPSAHSDYSVASSVWQGGRGDVVADVADAARAAELAFGIYLSPWDRNHPTWGTPAYNDYYVRTLEELLSPDLAGDYGPPFEVWLDGAHGPEVTRDQWNAQDWGRWIREIRARAPGAVIALDLDVFWPGNEDGTAPETNWSVRPGFPRWAPYECDTTIREKTHWFWHPEDDPRSLAELVDMYFRSVGRGCTLLFNVPPDRRGLVSEEDAARLRAWRAALDGIFAVDLARYASATASSVRSGSEGWAAGAAVDGDPDSFWAADTTGPRGWIEIDLGTPLTANVAELAEPIAFGQRIASFRLEAWVDGAWRLAARGTTVNYKRLLRFPPVTAQRWRVVVEGGRAAPALSTVGLYATRRWGAR